MLLFLPYYRRLSTKIFLRMLEATYHSWKHHSIIGTTWVLQMTTWAPERLALKCYIPNLRTRDCFCSFSDHYFSKRLIFFDCFLYRICEWFKPSSFTFGLTKTNKKPIFTTRKNHMLYQKGAYNPSKNKKRVLHWKIKTYASNHGA